MSSLLLIFTGFLVIQGIVFSFWKTTNQFLKHMHYY